MLEKPDIPRLHRLVDWAAAEDAKGLYGEWDQTVYICNSTCCVAGKTVLEEGGTYASMGLVTRPGGARVFVDTWASQILGLNSSEAGALFHGSNTVDDLRRIVADIESGVYRR